MSPIMSCGLPPADERRQVDESLQRVLDGWQWLAADDYNNAMTLLHTAQSLNCHGLEVRYCRPAQCGQIDLV